jgi:hypothetical protein
VYGSRGEPGGAKAQTQTISMSFRVIGPVLAILPGVRCSAGDRRVLQTAGSLHSLWRAYLLIDASLQPEKSGFDRSGFAPLKRLCDSLRRKVELN